MAKDQDRALTSTAMAINLKENGKMMKNK